VGGSVSRYTTNDECLFFLATFISNRVTLLGRSVISVLTFIPYSWFSQWSETTVKKRGDEYNALKHEIGQKIIDQVVHLFPKLKVKTNHFPEIKPTSSTFFISFF
jgi:all-trans-retinol 13,14-reductase